jgi:hypothetical protein
VPPGYEARLERAKARLDRLELYPQPVDLSRVRVLVTPWFFRLPGFGRFTAFALWRTILLRQADVSDDLLTHELCHVWQAQHHPWRTTVEYLTRRYLDNPYEIEARKAVADSRAHAVTRTGEVPAERARNP